MLAGIHVASGHALCLCCWMLWLLLMLTLTVIARLISFDVAGMK